MVISSDFNMNGVEIHNEDLNSSKKRDWGELGNVLLRKLSRHMSLVSQLSFKEASFLTRKEMIWWIQQKVVNAMVRVWYFVGKATKSKIKWKLVSMQ